MTDQPRQMSRSTWLWLGTLCVAIGWPVVYTTLIHPIALSKVTPDNITVTDLASLLSVRRYALQVPTECDGFTVLLEIDIEGQPKQSIAQCAAVSGGKEVVLLTRRNRTTNQLDICWCLDNKTLAGEVVSDPLNETQGYKIRGSGNVAANDWLFRGSRSGSDDVEVRVVLQSPHKEEGA